MILPLVVAARFVLACGWADSRLRVPATVRCRRMLAVTAGTLAWLLLTWLAAGSGVLSRFDAVPPPFAGLLLAVFAVGVVVPCSPLGTRLVAGLPLWVLVGLHVFRLPLELLLHRAYVEGLMPVPMSYSGLNWDILSGITAGLLGAWLCRGRVPRAIVAAWNWLGFALLVNIVTVAVLSTPIVRGFGDDRLNTFVAHPPFVWLPAVLVVAALMGHILVWRKLGPPGPPHPDPLPDRRRGR